jgi:thiol-disulfide isomerase/thioredoxin
MTDTEPQAKPAATRRPRVVFLVVGIALAVGLGVGLFTSYSPGSSSTPPVPTVGNSAPAFSLPRLGGAGTVGLPSDGGGSGKPVVLLFFGSWCAPCQSEIPALAAAYRSAHSGALHGVSMLGVDGLDPTKNALQFVHDSQVTFPVGVDSQFQVTEGLYGLLGDPGSVFVSGKGTIVHIVRGPLSAAQLLKWGKQLS